MSALESLVKRNRRGVFAGTCPPRVPGLDVYCAKAPAPDGALYDFELLITIVRNGDLVEITQLIPVANGELLMATRSVGYQVSVRDRYVKKIQSDSQNFGVVRIDRAKVSEYYRHFVKAFFRSQTSVKRFDANQQLLEEKGDTSNYAFPPLPETRSEGARFNLADAEPVGRIWFPQFTVLDDGDFEVEDGQIVLGDPAAPAAAMPQRAALAPGIYIEVLGQDGLSITVFNSVDANGHVVPLSATECKKSSSTSMWEVITKKKKSSWFRKKTKIKVIREELLDVKTGCTPIPI
jgi:hypothetical protein